MRVPVKADAFAASIAAIDVTDPRQEHPIPKSAPKKRETWQRDESVVLTLEDAGMTSQPPASTWAATISPGLTATDGQTLGYTWMVSSRTGISARSRASAMGMACGNRAVAPCCPFTHAIF